MSELQNPRKERILAAIVELYNQSGEPVSSKRLAQMLPDALSPATIRNEMAALAELGLLEQPHTSSGRVPSPKGYRYYVDHLLPRRELPLTERRRLEAELRQRAREPERLLENAGRLLAELTACTALCLPRPGAECRIKRIEAAPLSHNLAMLALLTTHGAVKSKVIRCELGLPPEALERFAALVQRELLGRELRWLSQAGLQTLMANAGDQVLAVAPLLAGVAELAEAASAGEVVMGDAPHVHGNAAHIAPEELQCVLQAVPLHPWLKASDPHDVQVLLQGCELPEPQGTEGLTLLLSPYDAGAMPGGYLGLAGTRINYAEVIPWLRCIADLLGRILEQNLCE